MQECDEVVVVLEDLLTVGDVKISPMTNGRYMIAVFPPHSRAWFYGMGETLEKALEDARQRAVSRGWLTAR